MVLPKKIGELTLGRPYVLDETGMSGSQVRLYSDRVLKIMDKADPQELALMDWLRGKLPVPEILACEQLDGKTFLLMTRLPGEMACSERYMQDPKKLTRLLAQGLQQLWQVDVSRCPVDMGLSQKLAQARYNVEQGLVDMDNVQPDTFGSGGFLDPQALLDWLTANQPKEEPVLSHGDYCLPNVFLDGDRVAGFLDLGRGGVADKWCDIALCYRSLRDNFAGVYSGKVYPGFDPMLLFSHLGLDPDWDKIRYYILLDELF